MQQKVILVTGASGRVARLLMPFLIDEAGLRMRWQSRRATPLARDWVCCDPVRDFDQFTLACQTCAAIIHLGGVTPASRAPDFSVNDRLGVAVLRAAQQARVPLMLSASSVAVYGAAGRDFRETENCAPITPYGQSKLAAEKSLSDAARGGPTRVVQLRIGNVLGADALMQGQPRPTVLHRFGDGSTPVRSYIAPPQLAQVLRTLTRAPDGLPSVLNVAAPLPVDMADLLDAAGLQWRYAAAPPYAQPRVVLQTDRLQRRILGLDWPDLAGLARIWRAQTQLPACA